MKKVIYLILLSIAFVNCDKGIISEKLNKDNFKITYEKVAESKYSVILTRCGETTILDTVIADKMPENKTIFCEEDQDKRAIKRHIHPEFVCYHEFDSVITAFGYYPDILDYFRTYSNVSWMIRNFFIVPSLYDYKEYRYDDDPIHDETKICLYIVYDKIDTENRVDMFLSVQARINGNMVYRFYVSNDIKLNKLHGARVFFNTKILPLFQLSSDVCKVPIEQGTLIFIK